MAAGKIEPLICDSPFELWPKLEFVMNSSIKSVYGINMPCLKELYIESTQVDYIPFEDLANIEKLTILGSDFDQMDLEIMPKLRHVSLNGCGLALVNAAHLVDLEMISVSSNATLTQLSISGSNKIKYLNADYCSLSQNCVNEILGNLVNGGMDNGSVYIRYGNNQPPSAIAQDCVDILVSRGWKIYTN